MCLSAEKADVIVQLESRKWDLVVRQRQPSERPNATRATLPLSHPTHSALRWPLARDPICLFPSPISLSRPDLLPPAH